MRTAFFVYGRGHHHIMLQPDPILDQGPHNLHACRRIPFIIAGPAAVYLAGADFPAERFEFPAFTDRHRIKVRCQQQRLTLRLGPRRRSL